MCTQKAVFSESGWCEPATEPLGSMVLEDRCQAAFGQAPAASPLSDECLCSAHRGKQVEAF